MEIPLQQFRIWNPDAQKFCYSGGTPSMLASFFSTTARLNTYYKMPYERMTFLNDKNGNDIYEGDILDGGGSWQRQLVEYRAQLGLFKTGFTPEKATVVGNIHATPKLLRIKNQI